MIGARVVISRSVFGLRVVVRVEPRRFDRPSQSFADPAAARSHAVELAKALALPLVDEMEVGHAV